MTPDPLTPADCDLRGMEWMPLYGARLFGSDFDAHASDAEFRAGVQLWWAAWNQVPAASLPTDDIALCRLAGLGRDLKAWARLKERALHGFVECADGRLYHRQIAAFARESWARRVADREKKKRWRERRGKGDTDGDGTVTETGTGTGTEPGQRPGRDGSGTVDKTRRDETRRDSNNSVPNGTAGEPALDLTKALFDSGVKILTSRGVEERQARALIGKWRKDHGDAVVLETLGRCQNAGVSEPVAWMTAALGQAKRQPQPESEPWTI